MQTRERQREKKRIKRHRRQSSVSHVYEFEFTIATCSYIKSTVLCFLKMTKCKRYYPIVRLLPTDIAAHSALCSLTPSHTHTRANANFISVDSRWCSNRIYVTPFAMAIKNRRKNGIKNDQNRTTVANEANDARRTGIGIGVERA